MQSVCHIVVGICVCADDISDESKQELEADLGMDIHEILGTYLPDYIYHGSDYDDTRVRYYGKKVASFSEEGPQPMADFLVELGTTLSAAKTRVPAAREQFLAEDIPDSLRQRLPPVDVYLAWGTS